jgi:hypothetical protein
MVNIITTREDYWPLLIASQPTGNAALRMRVWRETKALGAAALRDGAYLLPPQANTGDFDVLVAQVQAAGGHAEVLAVQPRPEQARQWPQLFDRSAEYAALYEQCEALARQTGRGAPAELLRRLQSLEQAAQKLYAVDYFPGAAREQVQRALQALRQQVQQRLAPDEPRALRGGRMAPLAASDYRGKTWATRKHLWIDRVACVWLIRRFIDPQARFVWIAGPADKPKRAIGFDFDGAEFTHRGGLVTFEVLLRRFSLDGDAALARLGAIVHALDAGGVPVAEAAGVEALLAGLRELHDEDDVFAQAAGAAFDAWHAAFRKPPGERAADQRK